MAILKTVTRTNLVVKSQGICLYCVSYKKTGKMRHSTIFAKQNIPSYNGAATLSFLLKKVSNGKKSWESKQTS